MRVCTISDVCNWAIQIEQQGELFYEQASGYSDDKDLRKLLVYLKNQEIKHIRRFTALNNAFSKKKSPFTVDQQFENLLDAFMRGMAFFDVSEVRDKISRGKKAGTKDLLRLAMDVELNTLLFYQKLSEYIRSKPAKSALSAIIREEESHLIKLRNLRKEKDPLYGQISPRL